MRRSLVSVLAVLSLVMAGAAGLVVVAGATSSPASADVQCQQWDQKTGTCLVWITVGTTHPSSQSSTEPTGSTGDSGPTCYYDPSKQNLRGQGHTVPCTKPGFGYWSNQYNCYISLAKPQPPAGDPNWQGHQPGDGAVYNCYQPETGMAVMIWAANPPAGVGQQITPEQVAQIAIKRMHMTAIKVGLAPTPVESSPKAMGVIGVPVWMWVANPASSTYGPIETSASAGGITVTATATAERVEWNMGDGSAPITCGQGTPYNSSVDVAEPSPDCGYTYQKTSWDQPNHEYTVTASSYWRVDWTGAGQQGTIRLPALVSRVHIREGELQVLNNQG